MNYSGWKRARRGVLIAGAAALLVVGGCRKEQKQAQPKPLSPEGVALRAMADRARLDTMRWPDFADLKKPVEDFYGAHDFEPVWVKGNKADRAGAPDDGGVCRMRDRWARPGRL